MKVRDRFVALLTLFWITFGAALSPAAQQTSIQQETAEEQQKQAAALQKKAALMLEQIIAEARILRLPENRVSILISGGDLLWDRDQPRARGFFAEAAGGVAELMQRTEPNDRPQFGPMMRSGSQLRQELLLTVARRDPALAYQFLQSIPQPPTNNRDGRRPDTEAALEQNLTAQIAAADPKLAVKNAQDWLDKGQYPSAIARVLSQVQMKDQKLAAKFAGSVLSRLQSEDLLANQEAARLSLTLLQPGPRPNEDNSSASQPARSDSRALDESAYRDLMESVIASALRATPETLGNGRGGRGGPNGGGPANNRRGGPPNNQAAPTDAQNRQVNARALLSGLQSLLPQVDQYLPARSGAVRQKLTELGIGNDQRAVFGQLGNLMQQGTSDSIIAAASSAPQQMQSRLYQQAAIRALDEGNADRARQIAAQFLDANARNSLSQTIELREKASLASANSLEEIRRGLSRLPSDEERARQLLPLVRTAALANNSKLALQLLEEARNMVSRRASNYRQFELQLNVASSCISVDPSRGFELLGNGISQLNELLSAAALLSGFEVNIFRDGELPVEEGNSLTTMIIRYGQVLASLAKTDFERAQITADGFQLPEARIIARLSIVRGVLGVPSVGAGDNGFGGPFGGGRGFGPNPGFRRQQ